MSNDKEREARDWWKKHADEIEARVGATGSQEAMRCYTEMRALLQQVARASLAASAGSEPVAVGISDPLDALRWGANVAETLLSIGRAIGFGRAQQILGEQWEAAHNCAPRGRMGVTVKDEATCQMCCGKPYPGCNTEFQGEAACRFTHPSPPEGMVGGWTQLPGQLPEPGMPVLLDIGKKFPIRAMWAAKHTVEAHYEADPDWTEYDEATDQHYCPQGWYEWNEHEEVHWAVSATPRAWAQMPPPPSAEGVSHG